MNPDSGLAYGYNTVASGAPELIKIQNYAYTFMGYGAAKGFNSFYDTDIFHIYATNHSSVWAQYNYWGPGGPSNFAENMSFVEAQYPLSYDPTAAKVAQTSSSDIANSADEKEDEAEFMAAIGTGFAGDYIKAKEQLNALIDKETTLKYPVLSLLAYDYFTKREADDPQSTRNKSTVESELTVLLNDLSAKEMGDPLRPFGLKLSARQAALNGEYAAFSSYNNQLIEEYPQSIHELTSLFDEISYQVEVKEDYSRAKELLARMDKAYPDEELTVMAQILMGENIDLPQPKIAKATEIMAASIIPKEFKLHQAFPNPFGESHPLGAIP